MTVANNGMITEDQIKGGKVFPTDGKHCKMKYQKDNGKKGLLTFGKYPEVSLF